MFQQQPDGSIADVGDSIAVDTQALKQAVYDWEHSYILLIGEKGIRDQAQAKLDTIKQAVPSFDETPLDPNEHAQALALLVQTQQAQLP